MTLSEAANLSRSTPAGAPATVTRSYKFRAAPTVEQAQVLRRYADGHTATWNRAVAARLRWEARYEEPHEIPDMETVWFDVEGVEVDEATWKKFPKKFRKSAKSRTRRQKVVDGVPQTRTVQRLPDSKSDRAAEFYAIAEKAWALPHLKVTPRHVRDSEPAEVHAAADEMWAVIDGVVLEMGLARSVEKARKAALVAARKTEVERLVAAGADKAAAEAAVPKVPRSERNRSLLDQSGLSDGMRALTGFWSDGKVWSFDAVPGIIREGTVGKLADSYRSFYKLAAKPGQRPSPPSFRSSKMSDPVFVHKIQHATMPAEGCGTDAVRWVAETGKRAEVRLPMPTDKTCHVDGWVRVIGHRRIPPGSSIVYANWSYRHGHWWVSLSVNEPVTVAVAACGPVVAGVDRGVNKSAQVWGVDTTTGEVVLDESLHTVSAAGLFHSDGWSLEERATATRDRVNLLTARKRRAQRSLARSHHLNSPQCWVDGAHVKGSCPWRKNKPRRAQEQDRIVAQCDAEIARIRREGIEAISKHLVDRADLIVFEDLKVRNMTASAAGTVDDPGAGVAAKRGLNKSILNQAWAVTKARVDHKAKLAALDGRTVEVDEVPAAGTSKRCSECRERVRTVRKKELFVCKCCGYSDDADRNAARNIAIEGAAKNNRQLSPTPEVRGVVQDGPVKPPKPPARRAERSVGRGADRGVHPAAGQGSEVGVEPSTSSGMRDHRGVRAVRSGSEPRSPLAPLTGKGETVAEPVRRAVLSGVVDGPLAEQPEAPCVATVCEGPVAMASHATG